jgi:hypothetical protein
VDWRRLFAGEPRRRVRLPHYPFDKVWCALYAPGEEYALVQRALGAQRLGYGGPADGAPVEVWPDALAPIEAAPIEAAPIEAAPTLAERPAGVGPFVAPATDTEERLAELFARSLGLRQLGVEDDIFELGAQSLMLVAITNHLRGMFGVNVAPARIFETTTVRALSRVVDALRAEAPPAGEPSCSPSTDS